MDSPITPQEYDRICTLLCKESGISLGEHKQSLVVSRLSKHLRHLNLDGFDAYYCYVTEDDSREEFPRMVDLLSTNQTDLSREPKHFKYLRGEILQKLDRGKRIRIWYSPCSTGEEPYTSAISLYEGVKNPGLWDVGILASNLATRANIT